MSTKSIFICLFLLLFSNTATQAEENQPMSSLSHEISRIEKGLTEAIGVEGIPIERKNLIEEMNALKIPAVSIAVINNGEIEWAKAYGKISSATSKQVDLQTCFQAGSVSKPIAAMGILTLVNDKILDLDENVNDRLISWKIPENEFSAIQQVTLRHLLSHTSGLTVIGFDGYTQNEPLPNITQTLDGIKPSNNPPVRIEFVPGSKMSYSGGAYNVAQQLVEDVTKTPFSQFMKNALLTPLNMNNSTFEHLKSGSNIAFAHPANGIPMDGGWKNYPESAAAGLWTTPTDVAKWLIEIQTGLTSGSKILNRDLMIEMVTPQVAVLGLGPMINGEEKNLELSFKGRTDGFTCGFVSYPYLGQGAIVMTNAANQLAFVDAVLRSISDEYQWPSYKINMKKAITLPHETLDKYVGRYSWDEKPNDIYDLFISREKDQLYWKIGSASSPSLLYPEDENKFFSTSTGYDIVFNEKDNAIIGLTIIVQKGNERDFRKLSL